jgi:hypothetical protein
MVKYLLLMSHCHELINILQIKKPVLANFSKFANFRKNLASFSAICKDNVVSTLLVLVKDTVAPVSISLKVIWLDGPYEYRFRGW